MSQVFAFQNKSVRTITENNEIWFAAIDVCRALGISWSGSKILKGFPSAWQRVVKLTTLRRGEQETVVISEPAVYKLAFRSNKPEADAFTNWVASEVLPAIRRTGKYEALPKPKAAPKTKPKALPAPKALPTAPPGLNQADLHGQISDIAFHVFSPVRQHLIECERIVDGHGHKVSALIRQLSDRGHKMALHLWDIRDTDNRIRRLQIDTNGDFCRLKAFVDMISHS